MTTPPSHAAAGPSEDELRFERACEWFIELREQQHSPETVASWLEWCGADPRNREAFERARHVWTITQDADERSPVAPRRPAVRRMRLAASTALAATIAAAAFLVPHFRHASDSGSVSILETPIGVNRETTLADGSRITLGGGSRVVVALGPDERHLALESGEAYFKVARERLRPFVVAAGPVRVTALGTEFNVRAGDGRVVVAVAQGRVQIDSAPRGASSKPVREPLRAGAGETVSLDTLDASMQLAHTDPANMASWQQGRLEFTREPLSAVIDSVNRYSSRRIALADESLGELRFTGTVFTDRVDDWIRGLPRIFPVALREEPSQVTLAARPR